MVRLQAVGRLIYTWAPWLIVGAYVVIAALYLDRPGTQYDEALYVNAALGGVDDSTFMTKTFHGLPVLLMPYIGALKAYVFYPIFEIFGVSAITMRLPVILLTASGLWMMYRLLASEVGRRLSLLILALTALDASFIMFTRLDNGPVVLDFVCKMAGLLVLLHFMRHRRLWWLAGFWAIMFLGVFNKVNFLWDVNAFLGAVLLVYGRTLWQHLRGVTRQRTLLISIGGYAACIGYYLYINATYHLGGKLGFVGWTAVHNNLVYLVDGDWFYMYALSPSTISTSFVFWAMTSTIVAAGLGLLYARHRPGLLNDRLRRSYIFFGLILIFLLGQIMMTKNATAGWHYFSIYPFFGISFVLGIAILGKLLLAKRQQLATWIMIVVISACCFWQLHIYGKYIAAYRHAPHNATWSPAIYDLAKYAKSRPSPIISLDWGMQTQLIGFDGVPNKYVEVFGPVGLGDTAQNDFDVERYITSKPNAYYVAHVLEKRAIPATADQFFDLGRRYGYEPHMVKVINDESGPVFEIYQLRKKD